MYLNILKRDLKRKKTMNIILLLFIILATTFVSSSINNMTTITTALDSYLEKAGMPDYLVSSLNKGVTENITEVLDNIEDIESYKTEDVLYLNSKNVSFSNTDDVLKNTAFMQSFEGMATYIFDENNDKISRLDSGKILVPEKLANEFDVKTGDTITIKIGDVSNKFEVAGSYKDAIFGSEMMGINRFIINQDKYNMYMTDDEYISLFNGNLCYITTDNIKGVEQELNKHNCGINLMGDQNLIKMTYVMDMVIAGVLLVVSICLILISFVVLRFTIGFTISEEYREIGVMKAIGIRNVKIRGLYMVKYLALALIGTAIGFFISIPFGNLMLGSVSKSIIMENENTYLINLLCSLLVIVVILLFCFKCTGKTKKFTPVDAIRNGETGKRFKKKGIFKLSKTPLKPSGFLAFNDVVCNPKRFGIIILTFTLCLSLILIFVNTVNTLKSGDLIEAFGMANCDVCYANDQKQMEYMVDDGRQMIEDEIERTEDMLEENDMPGKVFYDVLMKFTVTHGDNTVKSWVSQGIGTSTEDYQYYEGTPPQNENEIAITKFTAEKLGVDIGDTVTISQLEGEKEYIITAKYHSMMNMGEGIRVHESVDINLIQSSGCFAFQIDFTDEPNEAEIADRIEKLRELLDCDNIMTAGEFVDMFSGASSSVDSVRILVLALSMVIIILITVLMERSFIAKERGEIALLKAIGFKNSAIIKWHSMRFVIVAIISAVISLATLIPLTSLVVGPIFSMMGASYGIEYKIIPLQVFVIYPLIVIATTLISAVITALHTRTVSASESSGIE